MALFKSVRDLVSLSVEVRFHLTQELFTDGSKYSKFLKKYNAMITNKNNCRDNIQKAALHCI